MGKQLHICDALSCCTFRQSEHSCCQVYNVFHTGLHALPTGLYRRPRRQGWCDSLPMRCCSCLFAAAAAAAAQCCTTVAAQCRTAAAVQCRYCCCPVSLLLLLPCSSIDVAQALLLLRSGAVLLLFSAALLMLPIAALIPLPPQVSSLDRSTARAELRCALGHPEAFWKLSLEGTKTTRVELEVQFHPISQCSPSATQCNPLASRFTATACRLRIKPLLGASMHQKPTKVL